MRYLTIVLVSCSSAAGLFFLLVLALAPAPIAAEYWVREMIVIKRDIAKRFVGKRKIVIASGSSTLFGIDAGQLAVELGVPAINLGLHKELSLKTILNEADVATEPGDTVILPLEPSYYCMKEPSKWQVRNAIGWDRAQWESWPIWERIHAASLFNPTILYELLLARLRESFWPETIAQRLAAFDDAQILKRFSANSEPTAFSYSAFNLDSLGNMRKIEGSRFTGVPSSAEARIDICPHIRELLASYVRYMSQKNVAIFFANTPYVLTRNLDMARVEDSSRQFAGELSLLAPVLDKRAQLGFPRNLFLNTDLHLNAEGRRQRTSMLASSIRQNREFLSRLETRLP